MTSVIPSRRTSLDRAVRFLTSLGLLVPDHRRYAESLLDEIAFEFDLVIADGSAADKARLEDARQAFDMILAKSVGTEFSLEDVRRLRLLMVTCAAPEALAVKASAIIDDYERALARHVDQELIARADAAAAAVRKSPSAEAVLTLRTCLSEMLRRVNVALILEEIVRTRINGLILFYTFIGGVTFLAMLFSQTGHSMWLAAAGGLAGGMMSTIRRVIALKDSDRELARSLSTFDGFWASATSPLFGCVGGIAMLALLSSNLPSLIFAPDLLKLLPKSTGVGLWALTPDSPASASTLLLLCVAAGFSERWVPDMLDYLKTRFEVPAQQGKRIRPQALEDAWLDKPPPKPHVDQAPGQIAVPAAPPTNLVPHAPAPPPAPGPAPPAAPAPAPAANGTDGSVPLEKPEEPQS